MDFSHPSVLYRFQPLVPTIPLPTFMRPTFQITHMSQITWFLSFCAWFILFSIVTSSSIQDANKRISLFFMAEWYSIMYYITYKLNHKALRKCFITSICYSFVESILKLQKIILLE